MLAVATVLASIRRYSLAHAALPQCWRMQTRASLPYPALCDDPLMIYKAYLAHKGIPNNLLCKEIILAALTHGSACHECVVHVITIGILLSTTVRLRGSTMSIRFIVVQDTAVHISYHIAGDGEC